MLPLPLDYVNRLYHGELAPVGIDDKVWSESHDGSRRVKYRLTHDQSFETSIGRSVNGRLRWDALPPLSYGGRFSRVVHYVVSLRLIGKFDFKAAYRRVSLHGDISEKCTIMYNQFSLPSLRLTFSRSPCPHEFCFFFRNVCRSSKRFATLQRLGRWYFAVPTCSIDARTIAIPR